VFHNGIRLSSWESPVLLYFLIDYTLKMMFCHDFGAPAFVNAFAG